MFWLTHFSNIKTTKIPSTLDADTTDAFMGLNENAQSPGETNVNADATNATMALNYNFQDPGKTNVNDVHNDQHGTTPSQIYISSEHKYDHSSLTVHYKLLAIVTPDEGYRRNKLVTHPSNNLVTMKSSLLWKYLIHPKVTTGCHGYKPQYKGSYHSNTESSHGK